MTNLGRTQADWAKLFREYGIFLGPQRELQELAYRFSVSKTRTRVLEQDDVNQSTSGWQLQGVKIGTNTDEAGTVFIRIALGTPAAGQAQVSLYRAAGGAASDLVAQGAGALGALIPLTTQNNLGLWGSVELGQVTVSEQDDKHRLLLYPDWASRMHSIFDGSEPEHGALLEAFMTALATAETSVTQALAAFSTATDTYLESRWKDFQRSSQSSPIQTSTEDDQGAITITAQGLLEDGRDNMVDELTAGPQSVARTSVTAAQAIFDPTTQGKGLLPAPELSEWAEAGLVTAICTDGTLGAESFALTQHLDSGDDKTAQNALTIRRGFKDPALGINQAYLDRVLTLDSGAPADFGAITGFAIQGESAANTDQGKIYLKVVAQGTSFGIEGYTASSFDPKTKVFTTAPAAAGASVAILAANNSGLSGTAVLGTKPTVGDTGVLNLNPFAIGDKFVIDVTVSAQGAFQEAIARLYGYALASADPTKATIDDRYVTAGTLPPFEDQA